MKKILFILLAVCLVHCKREKDDPAPEVEKFLSRPTVFLASNNNVYAIDADSGKVIWKQNASFYDVLWHHTTPTYANGVVYWIQKSSLVAYDAITGSPKWNTTYLGSNSPTAKNGNVYSTDGVDTYCFDGKTGEEEWAFHNSKRSIISHCFGSPTVKDSVLYSGSYYTTCFAVNAFTGKSIWVYDPYPGVAKNLNYRPIVANGVVYLKTDTYMAALNAADGKEIWRASFKYYSRDYPNSPVLANGSLYLVEYGALLSKYDAATGNKIWEFDPAEWGNIYSCPEVWNNLVFFSSYGDSSPSYVYALDISTGQLVWKYKSSKNLSTSPVVYNGNIYIGNAEGLHVIDPASGQLKWKVTLDNNDAVITNLCIVDTQNKIYTVANSGDHE